MKQVNDALAAAIAGLGPVDQLRAFVRTYLRLIDAEPAAAEVLTIQEHGDFDALIPSHIAARMIFGMLDELALAWVLAQASDVPRQNATGVPGRRPKKFDIVRAADWAVALITSGIGPPVQQTVQQQTDNKELP
ncbi:MAG: hypothetical protein NT062_36000 [Proteobacteria bacterium]|nr:hypothetical protein [Pseudomonadota bacterium]